MSPLICLSLVCTYFYQIFGPVQSILKFTDTEDVLDRCNATEYGLAAGVFSKDIATATYMAHNLKGGITW